MSDPSADPGPAAAPDAPSGPAAGRAPDRAAEGRRVYAEVLGRPYPDVPLSGLRELTVEHLFGRVWGRPGLSYRDRSLITLALLAAQGRPDQLRDHVRGALRRGMSREEILEVMVHAAHYAGWAAGTAGQGVAEAVFAEEAERSAPASPTTYRSRERTMDGSATSEFLKHTVAEYRRYRTLAERALAQVDDEAFFAAPGAESNSLAVIVKHVGGNLRSRFTDFLGSDGEKPDRDRDGEFEIGDADTRPAVMSVWEAGWLALFGALDSLGEDDLPRAVRIRGEPLSVVAALQRSLAHTVSHVGQIVLLARLHAGARWDTLSIPRGGSREFNAAMDARAAAADATVADAAAAPDPPSSSGR